MNNLQWNKIESERGSTFEIDTTYEKFNSDGTKERLRFVKYANTTDGKVLALHTKIRKTNKTLAEHFGTAGTSTVNPVHENEFLWDLVFNSSKEILIDDIKLYFGFELLPENKIKKVINTIKDIFNDKRK